MYVVFAWALKRVQGDKALKQSYALLLTGSQLEFTPAQAGAGMTSVFGGEYLHKSGDDEDECSSKHGRTNRFER